MIDLKIAVASKLMRVREVPIAEVCDAVWVHARRYAGYLDGSPGKRSC